MQKTFTLPCLFLFITLSVEILIGQNLFIENFDYPAADTLSKLGWTQIRAGDPIMTVSEGLKYNNYSLSDIGNAVQITHEGAQEVKNAFASVLADSVYCSLLVRVSDASLLSSGGLFLYLTPADGNIFSTRFTLYAKKNESDKIAFGISKGSGIKYTEFMYDLNQTCLIVMKYKFIADATDSIALWVNPEMMESEPEPNVSSASGNDLAEISEIILSQLTASNEPPDAILDGIQISVSWSAVVSSISEKRFVRAENFRLWHNYPNPFNPTTNICYTIPNAGHVSLKVYDIFGCEIQTLINSYQQANTYTVKFNAGSLATGVYLCELRAGNFTSTTRMLLVK